MLVSIVRYDTDFKQMTKLDEKNAALTKQIETLEQSAQDLAQELSLSKELSTPTPAHTKEIKQLQDKISQLQEENRSVAYLLDKSEKYVVHITFAK